MNVDDLGWGNDAAWIWAVVPLVLLFGFIWLGQWRQARIQALAARGPLPEQLDGRDNGWLALRGALVLGAALLIVVGLARPQWGSTESSVKNLGIDVAIALDASKSMKVGDIVPDRLSAAELEIHRVLDGLSGGRVGLVPFAGIAFVQTPLTGDFNVVKTYLSELRVEDMPRGGTAIGRAIKEALAVLVPDEGDSDREKSEYEEELKPFEGSKHKAILLFTDGEDHEGDPIAAAEEAARHDIKIFTIGVGTPQGRPVLEINDEGLAVGTVKDTDGTTPLFSALNVPLLKQIAQITGGEYLHLGTSGLSDQLLSKLDALEKAEYEATFENLADDQYHWAVVPAALLLLAEAWLSGRRRRRNS